MSLIVIRKNKILSTVLYHSEVQWQTIAQSAYDYTDMKKTAFIFVFDELVLHWMK